jgi:hypothetical protein
MLKDKPSLADEARAKPTCVRRWSPIRASSI